MTNLRYPSAEQIQAMELAARKARAEEMGRLARLAVAGLKSLFVRPEGRVPMKGTHHA
jgi:hypothetical protein